MKVYKTADETCILETPVCWGSNAAVSGGCSAGRAGTPCAPPPRRIRPSSAAARPTPHTRAAAHAARHTPQFDIQVFLRFSSFKLVVPISVRDIQFRVTARIVLHMVDVMPCIGGVTLSLLTTPHVDMRCAPLLRGVDAAPRCARRVPVSAGARAPHPQAVCTVCGRGSAIDVPRAARPGRCDAHTHTRTHMPAQPPAGCTCSTAPT
jgi:hypothetical protein